MNVDCTFLVNSNDKAEDLWRPFFTALKTQWPTMDMPIVLNTESKSFSFPGYNIKTFNICKSKRKYPWGKMLIETLKRIDTKYVLCILDDYWLEAPVDEEEFLKVFKWLDDNPDIACFSFYPCELNAANIKDELFEGYELRPLLGGYRFGCGVAVWRKERLMTFVRPHESAWEWEIWGTMRSPRYMDRIYVRKKGMPDVIPHGDPAKGGMVHRGKWIKEAVDKYSQIYDLSYIDFSKRGFEDFDEVNRVMNLTFKDKLKEPHLIRRAIYRLTVFNIKRWLSLR